ncbi:MAG: hypothetical protein J6S21_07380 [Victivallales bacterium]|nr:hypothetical protein [Victivallales bacterium]
MQLASEAQADSSVQCRHCGNNIPVPSQSDPDCCLIFREGDEGAGIALSVESVPQRIADGQLRPYDLMLSNGVWHPLDELYDLTDYLPPPPAMNEDEPELAISFRERTPVRGFKRLPKWKTVPGQPGSNAALKRLMLWIKVIAALTVLALGALAALYLRNYINSDFACLQTRNHTGKTIAVLVEKSERGEVTVKPGDHTNFNNLLLAFAGKQKIKYRIVGEGDGKYVSVKAHCVPGQHTMAVIGTAAMSLYRNLPQITQEEIPTQAELNLLADQISQGKKPDAALKTAEALGKRLKGLFIRTEQKQEYSSAEYNLQFCCVVAGNRNAAQPDENLPAVIPPASTDVRTRSATICLLDGHRKFKISGELPQRKYTVNGKSLTAKCKFGVEYSGDTCTVSVDLGKNKYQAIYKSGKCTSAAWNAK